MLRLQLLKLLGISCILFSGSGKLLRLQLLKLLGISCILFSGSVKLLRLQLLKLLGISCILFSGTEANCKFSFSDCEDYWMVGHRQTGEYHVVPMGMVDGFNIFCEMGVGWIVISFHI